MKKPTEKQLYNYIAKLLEEEFHVEPKKIKRNARLVEDLDLDSIDVVDFIMYANEKFDVDIPKDVDMCFYACRTIQDLMDVLMPIFDGDITKIPDRFKPALMPESPLWGGKPVPQNLVDKAKKELLDKGVTVQD